jgi:hypothetical protein
MHTACFKLPLADTRVAGFEKVKQLWSFFGFDTENNNIGT